MNKAIILLSFTLLISQEDKRELSTGRNDFNKSFQSFNLDASINSLTNDPFSKNDIAEFISAFNNKAPDLWNTWYYEYGLEEDDSVKLSNQELKEENTNVEHSLIWHTYICGGSTENDSESLQDSTSLDEFYFLNIPTTINFQKDPNYSVDAFIAAFNKNNSELWRTFFYDDFSDEEVDLIDSSIHDLDLPANNLNNSAFQETPRINENILYSLNESIQNNDLEIFPNPFSNELNFRLNKTNSTKVIIHIFDISGKLVYFATADLVSENGIMINTEMLARGVYICLLNNGNEIYNKKIVKE